MKTFTKPDLGKVDIKIMWQSTIFSQINRVMHAFTEGDPSTRFERIFMSVMGLESVLTWYKDDKYNEDIKDIETGVKEFMNEMEEIRQTINPTNVDFMRAKIKLDALMLLIGRSGFYPEKDTGISEEEGVYEPEESEDDRTNTNT